MSASKAIVLVVREMDPQNFGKIIKTRQAYTRMRKFSLHDRDNTNKRLLSMLFTAICNISSASLTTRGYPIKFALSLFQFSNRVMMMPTRVMANSYRQGSIAANHFVQSC